MIARARAERPVGPLTEDQKRLAEQWARLALHYARPWAHRLPAHADDLRSEALLGLVRASRAWNAEQDPPFPCFARDFIRSALRSYVRRQRPRGRRNAQGAPFPATTRLWSEPPDSRSTPVGRELDTQDAVDGLLRRLPASLNAVCRALYLGGQSRAELAHAIGRSRTTVNRLHEQAMGRLRAEFRPVGGGAMSARPVLADPVGSGLSGP